MPCTTGSELHPASTGSSARARRQVLDVIEDLPPLSLEFALADRAALAELFELTDVRDQVNERRRKPCSQVPVFDAIELRWPGVPGLQIKEGLESGVGNRQCFHPIFFDGHQPHPDPVGCVAELALEIPLEHLAVDEANRDLAAFLSLLLGGGRARLQRDPFDRGQRHQGALVVAGVPAQVELEVWLIEADGTDAALQDLIIKKPYGDGGGFSGL